MKKIFTILAFALSIAASAQDQYTEESESAERRDNTQNEISVGALNLIAFGAIDVAYERIINRHSSWSAELFFEALDDSPEIYNKDFSLTGKYKHFFGSNYARGFYVEGLSMISTGEYEVEQNNFDEQYTYSEESYTALALGFGVGGKFVSAGGFVVDLSAAIGRNFFHEHSPSLIGQFNVNLGYRF